MSKTKKTKSSARWLKEHFSDPYVKKAQQEGLRARSAYKLQEINDKYKFIKAGMQVVDLGAAPGGWSKIAAHLVGSKGKVIALDILPMKPLPNVEFIQGDFTSLDVVNNLIRLAGKSNIDVIISDMAPNLSGISSTDHARSLELVSQALNFALQTLKPQGTLLLKAFLGPELNEFKNVLRQYFAEVKLIKPKASRSRSEELFLLAQRFEV